MSSQFEAPGQPREPGHTVVNGAAAYRLPIKRWGSVEHHAARPRDEPVQRELLEVAGFPALGTHVVVAASAPPD